MVKTYYVFIDGVFQDILEAKSYEEAYKKAEERYPHVLDDEVLEVQEV